VIYQSMICAMSQPRRGAPLGNFLKIDRTEE